MTTTTNPSNRFSDSRLLLYAVIALVVVAAGIVLFGADYQAPALSIHSSHPDGAMAFKLWLEQSGYTVREWLVNPIKPGREDALFILNPLTPYTKAESTIIRDWVRKGHTLIVAGQPFLTSELLDAFKVSTRYLWEADGTTRQSQTGPLSVPFEEAKAEPIAVIETERTDMLIHAAESSQPLVVSFPEGAGRVWVFGVLRPFSNRGLHDDGNARLVYNSVADLPAYTEIAFDEARHGYGETRSAQAWLLNTSPGRGVIIAIVLTMIYLVLRGRRFGRAVPLPDERLRREPVEYIQAMATLFRRSGQRGEMLKHYRHQLRRRLSERYALDPKLDDVELVKTITFRDPLIDEADLRDVLLRLSHRSIGEADLVRVTSDVDRWLRKLA